MSWNGNALNKTTPVKMIDTANNISAGLDALAVATAFAGADRVSTQGNFDFTIDSATSDGNTAAEFKRFNRRLLERRRSRSVQRGMDYLIRCSQHLSGMTRRLRPPYKDAP